MKKLIILLGVLTVSLTSCLKDKPNVDFSNLGTFAEIVHAGKPYFGEAAITDPGTGADLTITRNLQINVTGQYAPTKDVAVTIAVDNSIIATYNASDNSNVYEAMPTGSYSISATTATIKAGTRLANFTVTFKKAMLDPAKSYMLPIVLKSATNASLSANYSIKYYHFIGNDFAGDYTWHFRRYNNYGVGNPPPAGTAPSGGSFDDVVTIYPVTGTHFQVTSGYYTAAVNYDVSYVKAGGLFSKFTIALNATDVARDYTPNNIIVTQAPVIVGYDDTKSYTFAEALKLLHFQYAVTGSGNARWIEDTYVP
ncbi:DUF1735 domain-containing protein [Mucilaginibacter sp. KACC 22773]|uniref:DUF1735 domain-containing protein n=1 Tax=Mucilaginibacter sp. KACC 22773 TaxID=3025671 RepID=UPI002365EEC3|nr:DUF1735 domain-containing protein [Mucilaginibacter sp. KACC 22773]WDF77704.1 DUF1735 domain-containing protein [Mucilaginibacter sp. KACC 22773]